MNNTEETPVQDPYLVTSPPEKPLYFWKGLGYALIILLTQLVVGGIVMAIGTAIYGADNPTQLLNLIIAIALPLSFLVTILIILRFRSLHPTAFQWKSHFLKLIPLGLLMLFGFNYILGELLVFLPNYEEMLADYKTMFAGVDMIYLFIGGVIVGPICEEIIFRGIIEEGFLRTYDAPKAILLSALIFGAIHLLPIQVLNAGLVGILLGWIYWKTRALWIVITLHVINNYVAFSFEDVDDSARTILANDFLYYATFPLTLILMYGAYYLFKKIAEEDVEYPID